MANQINVNSIYKIGIPLVFHCLMWVLKTFERINMCAIHQSVISRYSMYVAHVPINDIEEMSLSNKSKRIHILYYSKVLIIVYSIYRKQQIDGERNYRTCVRGQMYETFEALDSFNFVWNSHVLRRLVSSLLGKI